MRILDKYTDFYDFYQNIYPDETVTFDRTDSFFLTKESVLAGLYTPHYVKKSVLHYCSFVLLQVGNTFWLFLVEITKEDEWNKPKDFSVKLLSQWKDYSKERTLIKLESIYFDSSTNRMIYGKNGPSKEKAVKRAEDLVNAVRNNNYKVHTSFDYYSYYTENRKLTEKHIPLLIASGLSASINPLEIYLAFEEYFSLERTENERTCSKGLTDRERAENHGFGKSSFRGRK